MFGRTFLLALLCPWLICAKPTELTDKTWKQMVNGQWMVEFYAPWCSACQKFQPVWDDFSTAMASKSIKVASVNTEQYSLLSNRFRVRALPTVYYVRDGVFRQYDGERSLKALKSYIDKEEWRQTEPVPFYLAPNSFLMSFSTITADVPTFVKDTFGSLHDDYGWPSWVANLLIALVVIILGLGLGFGVLSFLNTFSACVSKLFTKSAPSNNQQAIGSTDTLLSQEDAADEVTGMTAEEREQTIRQRQ